MEIPSGFLLEIFPKDSLETLSQDPLVFLEVPRFLFENSLGFFLGKVASILFKEATSGIFPEVFWKLF